MCAARATCALGSCKPSTDISATEELKSSLRIVTQKQLQEECVRRGLAKSGTKADLLARLQVHEPQQNSSRDGVESDIGDEFAAVELELGTPIPDTPLPADTLMFDLPKDFELFIYLEED
jgi:hypothetical protein